jgi:flagella basal body P-ring formation protein FlgA
LTIVTILCVSLVASGGEDPAGAATLEIYLPREIKVEGDGLTLRDISLISARDEALVETARAIKMGRGPWSTEYLLLTRRTILARLASCGIDSDRVVFKGAREVKVLRDERTIAPSTILSAARKHLSALAAGRDDVSFQAVRDPSPIRVPGGSKPTLRAALRDGGPSGYRIVRVEAMDANESLGGVDVLFRLRYAVRKVVTSEPIAAGETITSRNTRVVKVASTSPEGAFRPPYGQIAKVDLPSGGEVRDAVVRNPAPTVAVQRNEVVEMRIEGEGFAVRAFGQALQDGTVGEWIKVRNIDTKRIVAAEVKPGGYVQPQMRR